MTIYEHVRVVLDRKSKRIAFKRGQQLQIIAWWLAKKGTKFSRSERTDPLFRKVEWYGKSLSFVSTLTLFLLLLFVPLHFAPGREGNSTIFCLALLSENRIGWLHNKTRPGTRLNAINHPRVETYEVEGALKSIATHVRQRFDALYLLFYIHLDLSPLLPTLLLKIRFPAIKVSGWLNSASIYHSTMETDECIGIYHYPSNTRV